MWSKQKKWGRDFCHCHWRHAIRKHCWRELHIIWNLHCLMNECNANTALRSAPPHTHINGTKCSEVGEELQMQTLCWVGGGPQLWIKCRKFKLFIHCHFNRCSAFDDNESECGLSGASHTSSQLSSLNTAWATLRAFGISNLLSKSYGLTHHGAQNARQHCKGVNKAIHKPPSAWNGLELKAIHILRPDCHFITEINSARAGGGCGGDLALVKVRFI